MNHLYLYQIISVSLFVFGSVGLLKNHSRTAIIAYLQIIAGGIILGLLATIRIAHLPQPADELTIILIVGVLVGEMLLGLLFAFRILKTGTDTDHKST